MVYNFCAAILRAAGDTKSPLIYLTFAGVVNVVLNVFFVRVLHMNVAGVVYNFCAAILRAAGDTKSPLIYLTFAGVVNVVLNVFFVRVLHMNVAGVALATIISQAISAVLVTWALMRRTDACQFIWKKMHIYKPQLQKMIRIGLPAGIQSSLISAVLVTWALMRRTDACQFIWKKMHIYKPQLQKMIRIGLPAGIQSSLFSISNVLIQSSVNSFGDVLMSGNAAAANIEGFVYVCLNAFHQTAVNFIGQNAGARQYHVRQCSSGQH